MGRTFYEIQDYKNALDLAIAESMRDTEGAVQTNAKRAIAQSAQENVYNAYPNPKFNSRRGSGYGMGGGIMNPDNILTYTTEKGFTLTMEDLASWQQLYGGATPAGTLAEVIENEGLYGASERPFMEKAENAYSDRFGLDLVSDLEMKGF